MKTGLVYCAVLHFYWHLLFAHRRKCGWTCMYLFSTVGNGMTVRILNLGNPDRIRKKTSLFPAFARVSVL